MRKFLAILSVCFLALTTTSFTPHKFYVSIYQVNFAPEKKMLQITSRIFLDDLNEAVQRKSKKRMFLGEPSETADQEKAMRDYLTSNISLKINNKPVTLDYRSKEVQDNVMICYFRVTDIASVKSLWIRNKNLFDYVTDQQNIIQTTIGGKKNSLLLTIDEPEDQLQF